MPAFTFFGGKGGVGKTTVSTAYAIRLARGGATTLIVSTDPAHSVGDLIDQPVGPDPVPVADVDGLRAQEIDPRAPSRSTARRRSGSCATRSVRGWSARSTRRSTWRMRAPARTRRR
jgi:arsenite efflux ATP-binding protein ArsA (TC 3.A.4.1.1)